jgi:gas vesicle protein
MARVGDDRDNIIGAIGETIKSAASPISGDDYTGKAIQNVSHTAEIIRDLVDNQDEQFDRLLELIERSVERGDHQLKLEAKLHDHLAKLVAKVAVDRSIAPDDKKADLDEYLKRLHDLAKSLTLGARPPAKEKHDPYNAIKSDMFGPGHKSALRKKMAKAEAEGKSFGGLKKAAFYGGRMLFRPFGAIKDSLLGVKHGSDQEEDEPQENFDTKVKGYVRDEQLKASVAEHRDVIRNHGKTVNKKTETNSKSPGTVNKKTETNSKSPGTVNKKTETNSKSLGTVNKKTGTNSKSFNERTIKILTAILGETTTIRKLLMGNKGVDKNLKDDFDKFSSSSDRDGKKLGDASGESGGSGGSGSGSFGIKAAVGAAGTAALGAAAGLVRAGWNRLRGRGAGGATNSPDLTPRVDKNGKTFYTRPNGQRASAAEIESFKKVNPTAKPIATATPVRPGMGRPPGAISSLGRVGRGAGRLGGGVLSAGMALYDGHAAYKEKKEEGASTGRAVASGAIVGGSGAAGAIAGAKIGAAVGAVGGPVGMLLGGIVGGGAGYLLGRKAGQVADNAISTKTTATIEDALQPTGDAVEELTAAVEKATELVTTSTTNPTVVNHVNNNYGSSSPDMSDVVGRTRSQDNSFIRFQDKRQARVL